MAAINRKYYVLITRAETIELRGGGGRRRGGEQDETGQRGGGGKWSMQGGGRGLGRGRGTPTN